MHVTRLTTIGAISVALFILCAAAHGEITYISGQVVDYLARPVADTEVAVFERVHDYSTSHDSGVLRDEIRRTDDDGRFVLTADVTLSAINVYMIVVRKDGYALGWDWLGQPYDNVIVLEQPSVLAGVLVDSDSRPVAGAKVRAAPKSSYLRRLEQNPVLAPESWLTMQTDERGAFRFERFSADVSTDFWVEAPGWALVYQFTTQMMSVCGFEVGRTDIRLVLPREVPLQGQVIDAERGTPVAGARVLLHPKSIDHDKAPFIPVATTSGQDGRFAFKGVPPGERYVNISPPHDTGLVDQRVAFNVRAGTERTEVTAQLRRGGTIEIVAREQETGRPISGLNIYLWQAVQDQQSNFYKYVHTDSNGFVRVAAPAGECGLSTRTDRYSPMFYDDQVLVAHGQTVRLETVLDPYATVSGLALDEAGQPVAGAVFGGAARRTDQAGRFEIQVPLDDPPRIWIARHPERNLAAVVSPAGSSPRIVLKSALTVCGIVTDPDGKGIPAARVALGLLVPGLITGYAPDVTTDSQGRFEVSAVAPEREGYSYRLSVDASGFGSRRYQRIAAPETGGRMEIAPIVLLPADMSVSGVVLDASGAPAAGVPVYARGDGQPSRSAATDDAGRFVVRRVCQGPLRIQASYDNVPGGVGFLEAQGGDQDVTVILGQDRVHQGYASLLGKPLPDLEALGLSSAEANERPILLCFFDFQQRPSRKTVLQLAKQAEMLEQKGIVAIAVQAAEVEAAALSEWVEQANIAVPIGRIRSDAEPTCLRWGVKSLPWLVLTDSDHVVRAEGFVLDDWDQVVQRVEDGQRR